MRQNKNQVKRQNKIGEQTSLRIFTCRTTGQNKVNAKELHTAERKNVFVTNE